MSTCPICYSHSSEAVRLHFYNYRRCNQCNHIWNLANEKAARSQLLKLWNRRRLFHREVLQNTLTQNHKDRRRYEVKYRAALIDMFVDEPCDILEIDCQEGLLQEKLEGFNYQGISLDKFYKPHLLKNSKIGTASNIHINDRFDVVLMAGYLEFSPDPQNDIIRCLSRLSKDGILIVDIPLNQDPAKQYTAASHCFSEESMKKLAKRMTKNYEVIEGFESAAILMKL